MKNTNILRSILLIVLSISGIVSVLAQGSDSRLHIEPAPEPPPIYISLADLPALLNGDIVGITLEQMDSLTVDMIDCDGKKEALLLYKTKLDTAYVEIEKRDTVIRDFTVLDDFNKREMASKDWLIEQQDIYIESVEKDLRKQKRKTTFAWITGALVTGAMAGLMISR